MFIKNKCQKYLKLQACTRVGHFFYLHLLFFCRPSNLATTSSTWNSHFLLLTCLNWLRVRKTKSLICCHFPSRSMMPLSKEQGYFLNIGLRPCTMFTHHRWCSLKWTSLQNTYKQLHAPPVVFTEVNKLTEYIQTIELKIKQYRAIRAK